VALDPGVRFWRKLRRDGREKPGIVRPREPRRPAVVADDGSTAVTHLTNSIMRPNGRAAQYLSGDGQGAIWGASPGRIEVCPGEALTPTTRQADVAEAPNG
jgi:hypothetical protein